MSAFNTLSAPRRDAAVGTMEERPLQRDPATRSLIAVLQSTMTTTPAKPRVLIPGKRKYTRVLPETTLPSRGLTPRMRYSVVIGTILFVVCLTFVSLAPLDNAQSSFHRVDGVIEWVHAQQQNWSISAQNDTAQDDVVALPAITLPASQYVAIASQDAINAGISPDYFVRQIYLESGFNPNAVSPYGAVGIAQFLPATAATLGVNPWDPISALRGAANLMASYSRQYGGDYAKALAAYNAGDDTVNYALRACGAKWVACLPAETQNYIHSIMG
ncbi:MAG: lytic transglycosylase domain-containing protein [Ktedonobacteraceae bacterium]|nr:lytic transglycosylase domain-containing protein [Ktedonobacteraceae bacterium]